MTRAPKTTPEQDAEPPPSKAINCGDCGETFESSREAAYHMREKHASVEAPGSGPPSNRPAKGQSA